MNRLNEYRCWMPNPNLFLKDIWLASTIHSIIKNGKYNRMQYEERKKKKTKEEIEKRKGWCLHLPIFAASSSIPFHLNHHHLLLIVEIFSKDYFLFTRIVSRRRYIIQCEMFACSSSLSSLRTQYTHIIPSK